MDDGWLVRDKPSAELIQVVLPEHLWRPFITVCHLEGGHQGALKTAERFAGRFYCPGWRRIADDVCTECPTCAGYCRGKPPRQGEMQMMEIGKPMERMAIDLVGPNPSTPRQNIYILTAIDSFSRYMWAVPIRNKLARTVIAALHRYVFSVWGLCREIYSDQGSEFNNELMDSICKE